MVQAMVVRLVISFVMKQLEKFEDSIDWDKVKSDADERVRALIPGTWFDNEAVAVINTVLDGVQSVLSNAKALKKVLELLADKKYTDALLILKQLLLDFWAKRTEPAVVVARKVVKKLV